MVKIIPLNKKVKRSAQILHKFYEVARPNLIEVMRMEIFYPKRNLAQRRKAYRKYNRKINKLKPLFKELVIERNNVAQKDGFKNFLDFTLKKDGVSKNELNNFFKNANRIIRDINNKLPTNKNIPSWYWSQFNIPNPLYKFHKTFKSKLPEDIYTTVKKHYPKYKKYLSRIDVQLNKDIDYPQTKYDYKNKKVIIKLLSTKGTIHNTLDFIHEIGHAIDFLRLVDRNKKPEDISTYKAEKEAYKFALHFQKKYFPKELNNATYGRTLRDIIYSLFEYPIHTNPNQDFDKAYAQAFNKCYLKSRQKTNPFYVLEKVFIYRPCASMAASIAQFEVLSEKS